MLWTIVPDDQLGDEEEEDGFLAEMSIGPVTVVVHTDKQGRRQVHRLMSTNPRDYLRPEWQPGAPWPAEKGGPNG